MHIDALGGGADLPGVEQRGPGHTRYGNLQVGVFGDDEGVFAAQFQVELLDLVGGDTGDACRFQAACESDHPHTRIKHERLSGVLAIASDNVDDARRQVAKHLARASVESGVISLGLMTTVLPAASAGATFHAISRIG